MPQRINQEWTPERVETLARRYHTSDAAAEAAGLSSGGAFARLCRRFEIQTPAERRGKRLPKHGTPDFP